MADGSPNENAIEREAASACPAGAGGQIGSESSTVIRPRRHRALRWLGRALAALLVLLVAVLAAVWVWSGTDTSLAQALRWAGAQAPLVTDEVTGSVRGGGKVKRLVWDKDGLRVEVHDAELVWTPRALLSRTLHINRLSASRIVVDDQRPKGEPSSGPPTSLVLPLGIQVDALSAGELRWAGPPPYALQDVAGRFTHDRRTHWLELDSARIEGGRYRARATLTAQAPIRVEVALAGALTAPVPGAQGPVPLTVQATLRGPLTEMQAQADLQAVAPVADAAAPAAPEIPALPPLTDPGATPVAPPAAAAAPAASAPATEGDLPAAHATARITPWAEQPLPEAHARVRAFDAGAVWADAPHTRLTGQLDITPLPAGAPPGWTVNADISNAAPGPWDQRALPLQQLVADLRWQGGVATVRSLKAALAGGTLESTGRWVAPPATTAAAPAPAIGTWQIDTRIAGVNPAALHTQLAAFPLDGTATVRGEGTAVDFDLSLHSRPARAIPPTRPGESPAEALARDLRALKLRDATATGRWADGLLALGGLRVRTDEAELAGSVQLRPATPGGTADLRLTLPGASATVKGELQPDRGGGTLRAQLQDAARTLAWAQKLPGVGPALAGTTARGTLTLDASWRGGWRDPAVQARLNAPQLDWLAPGSAPGTPPWQASDLTVAVNGQLAQAQLAVSGRVAQGERRIDLRLAATGGRTTPQATLAASSWRAQIGQLQAQLRDPALGNGDWQLSSAGAVPLSWTPDGGGQFEAGAGALRLTSPAPASTARIAWGPVRWRAGELTSTGRLTGLPLQWVERVAGSELSEAGLTGSVIFDGDWNVALGRQLRLSASVARASGDLTVLTTDASTGVQSRVAAGLRDARVTLGSNGNAVNLAVVWDSERAGTVNGQLRTELASTRSDDGTTDWSWPESAPLDGQLQARLPQISAWSVLAPPGWRLRGSLAADARVAGTRGQPRVHGTLGADDLAMRSVVDGLQFDGGRLRARLDGTRLLIDEFSLRGAGEQGGALRATGEAGLVEGRAQARLDATLSQLRASIRADRQVTVSGSVRAALDGRAVSANGRLQVDRAVIVLPDETRPTLGDDVIVRGPDGKVMAGKEAPGAVARPTSAAGQQAARDQARTDARRTQAQAEARSGRTEPLTASVNVQVDLGQDFRLRGMGIDTRLAGGLTLTAQGPLTEMPRLTGRVNTVGGTFRAYGQQLRIERGFIVFSGDISNPALDIVALRPNYASDQRVGVQVMGTALLPRVRLYSAPALPDNQTLAWLLLGRAAPSSGAEAAMLQSAALALLGGREGRGLAANFGLDELSFSGGDTGGLSSASVTLGKRLSDRLYAAYEHSLAGASGTLMIFYELSRRWTLRGQAGENSAIDLIYRLSFD